MAHDNAYPKLHNAMWPGLVGKGPRQRAADRPRHDARPDRQRRGRRREVRRRRPLPLRPAHQHRLHDGRHQAARRQDRRRAGSPSARSSRRSGRRPAAARRWATAEERKQFVDAGATRPAASASSCASSASAPTASSASTRPPAPTTGPRTPRATQKRIAETFREACDDRRGPRRAARRRGRDLLGRHALLAARWSSCSKLVDRPETRRLPGRHGPHAALHPRLQRARGPHPARGLRLERPADARRRAARSSPTRCGPGRSTSTSPRTTRTVHGSGSHDKTGRHCLADRPQRQARHRHARRLLAARRDGQADQGVPAHLLGRLHVPQRGDDEASRPGTTSWAR